MKTETGKCLKCEKSYFSMEEFLEHTCINQKVENHYCDNCGNTRIFQTTNLKVLYCPYCLSSGAWIRKSEEKDGRDQV